MRGIHRWPVNSQKASNAENVSIWWRHHESSHIRRFTFLHFFRTNHFDLAEMADCKIPPIYAGLGMLKHAISWSFPHICWMENNFDNVLCVHNLSCHQCRDSSVTLWINLFKKETIVEYIYIYIMLCVCVCVIFPYSSVIIWGVYVVLPGCAANC